MPLPQSVSKIHVSFSIWGQATFHQDLEIPQDFSLISCLLSVYFHQRGPTTSSDEIPPLAPVLAGPLSGQPSWLHPASWLLACLPICSNGTVRIQQRETKRLSHKNMLPELPPIDPSMVNTQLFSSFDANHPHNYHNTTIMHWALSPLENEPRNNKEINRLPASWALIQYKDFILPV